MIEFCSDIPEANFKEGCLFLIDKPIGWTSFDVVNKVRYAIKHHLQVKKIKVGHAGTLDPLATGLLLLCTGKYTKKINELTELDKTYTGTLKLGATTKSYDAELEEDEIFDTSEITEEQIYDLVEHFQGEIDQFPPVYSAIKIDGVASYKRTRKGEEVIMKSRKITLHSFEVTNIDMPAVDFKVECTKGTYIRSLAHDFGEKLNNGAYLTALRRTKTAGYDIQDAWKLEDLVLAIQQKERIEEVTD